MNRRGTILSVAALGVLVLLNLLVWSRTSLVEQGRRVYLALDDESRSLVRGGAVELRYVLARKIDRATPDDSPGGRVVVRLDGRDVAHFERLYRGGPLEADEHLVRWRLREHVWIGPKRSVVDGGSGERLRAARYGELAVGKSGTAVLLGICDADRRRLGGD